MTIIGVSVLYIFSYKFYSYELVTDTKMTEIRVTMLSNHKTKYNMIESNNTVHKEYPPTHTQHFGVG